MGVHVTWTILEVLETSHFRFNQSILEVPVQTVKFAGANLIHPNKLQASYKKLNLEVSCNSLSGFYMRTGYVFQF